MFKKRPAAPVEVSFPDNYSFEFIVTPNVQHPLLGGEYVRFDYDLFYKRDLVIDDEKFYLSMNAKDKEIRLFLFARSLALKDMKLRALTDELPWDTTGAVEVINSETKMTLTEYQKSYYSYE